VSIIKKSADLVYAFRFIRLLTTRWEDTEAFNLGIVDRRGKPLKKLVSLTSKERNHYTPFIRLVFNMKRILEKTPGAGQLASFASALYLIKESQGLSDRSVSYILEKSGVSADDLILENSQWFIVNENELSPGIYKVTVDKVLNEGFEVYVRTNDRVRVRETKPIGNMFGVDVYEAIHVKTGSQFILQQQRLPNERGTRSWILGN
jgi:hypothetical protein